MKSIWLALLLGCVALLAPAQAGEQTLEFDEVTVRLVTLWPSSITKGYQPLSIEINNRSNAAVSIDFKVSDYRESALLLTQTLEAGPNRKATFSIPVPVYIQPSQGIYVSAKCRGQSDFAYNLGSGNRDIYMHNVLILSAQSVGDSELEKWSEDLTPGTTPARGMRGRASGRFRNEGFNFEPTWKQLASVDVSKLDLDAMPSDWRMYTAFDYVVLDLSMGRPSDAALGALLGWVRNGGKLMLAGAQANVQVVGLDPLAPYLEARFLMELEGQPPSIRTYQCGVGRLSVAARDGLLDTPAIANFAIDQMRKRVPTEWTPSPRGSRLGATGIEPEIPGVGALPFRAFIVLMLIFGALIWPVNFYYVKKRGQPVLLLLTVPLIALVSSIIVVLYGLLGQGIDTDVVSESVAVLYQRIGVVSVAEARATYSGWAPGRGLVLGAGTGLFALKEINSWDRSLPVHRIIREDGEERYSSAFLPSRMQVRQVFLSDRASRLRLDVRADGSVSNGLGVLVDELLVHHLDGSWSYSAEPLAEGANRSLERVAKRPTTNTLEALAFDVSDGNPLPPGTYAARLNQDAFCDWGGLEVNQISSSHQLLGIFGGAQ